MGFTANNWVGSSGGGSGSYFNSGSPSGGGGGGFNSGVDLSKYWDSSSDPAPGTGSSSAYDWARKLPEGSDPFGFNKTLNQDKKESPWGDVARFAGDKLSSYAQSRYGQSGGFAGGGGGGVSQSGDLTIVYPQSPTVIPGGGKSGLGGALGTLAGIGASFIPGLGPGIAAAMPAIGGAFG